MKSITLYFRYLSTKVKCLRYLDQKFNEEHLKNVESLCKAYERVKLRENNVDSMIVEFKKYETVWMDKQRMELNMNENVMPTEDEVENFKTLLTILHPCFMSHEFIK